MHSNLLTQGQVLTAQGSFGIRSKSNKAFFIPLGAEKKKKKADEMPVGVSKRKQQHLEESTWGLQQ
jgi:hypothetical protein